MSVKTIGTFILRPLLTLAMILFLGSTGFSMIGGAPVASSDPLVGNVAQIFIALAITGADDSHFVLHDICTATFVSEDLLLTANHCILSTDSIKGFMALSKGITAKVVGYGRALSAGKEIDFKIVGVRRMSLTETDPTKAGDLAIIKIDRKFAGHGIALSARALRPHENLTTYGFGRKKSPSDSSESETAPAPEMNTAAEFKNFATHQPNSFLSDLRWGTFQQTTIPSTQEELAQMPPEKLAMRNKLIQTQVVAILRKSDAGGLCYGDSGGPNFLKSNGHFMLAGVSAQTQNETCAGYAVVFELHPYRAWLDQAARELGSSVHWAQ